MIPLLRLRALAISASIEVKVIDENKKPPPLKYRIKRRGNVL